MFPGGCRSIFSQETPSETSALSEAVPNLVSVTLTSERERRFGEYIDRKRKETGEQ